ncbi:MAG: LamG domain-containing protein, partial [Lentisphaeria bacterium]|nr:LamG domain-containing protein [Lentisphaeria bacterium]
EETESNGDLTYLDVTDDNIAAYLSTVCSFDDDVPTVTCAPEDNLAGWWKLDETTGRDVADELGTSPGTLKRSRRSRTELDDITIDGPKNLGSGLEFDGRVRVEIDHVAAQTVTTAATFSFWLKLDSYNNCQAFLSKRDNWNRNNSWGIGMNFGAPGAEDHLVFEYSTNGTNNNATSFDKTSIPLDEWTHLLFVYDSSDTDQNVRMFINGVEEAALTEINRNSAINSGTSDIYIGAVNNGGACITTSAIDDVRIYKRVLTSDEATDVYRDGVKRILKPVLRTLYEYNFHEVYTAKAADFKGNGKDLLLYMHSYTYTGDSNEYVGLDILLADGTLKADGEDAINQTQVYHQASVLPSAQILIGDWDGDSKVDIATYSQVDADFQIDIYTHTTESTKTAYSILTTMLVDSNSTLTNTRVGDSDYVTVATGYEDESSETEYYIKGYDEFGTQLYEAYSADAFITSFDMDNDGTDEWITKYLTNLTSIYLPGVIGEDPTYITENLPGERFRIMD